MKRRNRVAAFLSMPIVVLLCLIGWTLTFYGSKQEISHAKASNNAELNAIVLMPNLNSSIEDNSCSE